MIVTERPVTKIATMPHRAHLMLMSDLHLDAAGSDHKAIIKDFELARRHNARIALNGDVFDAILPKDLKRFAPGCNRESMHGRVDVVNASVQLGVKLLAPYADLIDFIGTGNHEAVIAKYHGSDIVAFLVHELNKAPNVAIAYGGYCGWWTHKWKYMERQYFSLNIRYHHGAGGSAPITKGMIDFSRMNAFVEGADVIWIGHKHNRFVDSAVKEGKTAQGRVFRREVVNIMTGSYLDTYGQQTSEDALLTGRKAGYAADMNLPPQRKGGVLLTVDLVSGEDVKVTVTL